MATGILRKMGKIKSKSKKRKKENPTPVSKQRIEVMHDIFQSVGVKPAAWVENGKKLGAETLHLG